MSDIIRSATAEEKADFEPIMGEENTARKKFYDQLTKAQQKAAKTKDKDNCPMPFADKAATDDFMDQYEQMMKLNVRKNGFLDVSEIKPVKMDWARYSDLKNFDFLEESDMSDDQLKKNNPGLDITLKTKKYKFKGYSNIYIVQEDATDAINRARKKLKSLE